MRSSSQRASHRLCEVLRCWAIMRCSNPRSGAWMHLAWLAEGSADYVGTGLLAVCRHCWVETTGASISIVVLSSVLTSAHSGMVWFPAVLRVWQRVCRVLTKPKVIDFIMLLKPVRLCTMIIHNFNSSDPFLGADFKESGLVTFCISYRIAKPVKLFFFFTEMLYWMSALHRKCFERKRNFSPQIFDITQK